MMCTECIIVFPDGVGVLPWMLYSTNSIGGATAEKMKEFRLVAWGVHGIYDTGKTMDETVEKAAQIYMLTAHLPRINTIRDEELVGGGVAYTVGIIFYKSQKKYRNFIWHLFVLAGSVLQYTCIALRCV